MPWQATIYMVGNQPLNLDKNKKSMQLSIIVLCKNYQLVENHCDRLFSFFLPYLRLRQTIKIKNNNNNNTVTENVVIWLFAFKSINSW